MRKWRIEDSEELYNVTGWGTSYFGINDKGHVVVMLHVVNVEGVLQAIQWLIRTVVPCNSLSIGFS